MSKTVRIKQAKTTKINKDLFFEGANCLHCSIDCDYDYGKYKNDIIGLYICNRTIYSTKPIGHILHFFIIQHIDDKSSLTIGELKKLLLWSLTKDRKNQDKLYDELWIHKKYHYGTDSISQLTKVLKNLSEHHDKLEKKDLELLLKEESKIFSFLKKEV